MVKPLISVIIPTYNRAKTIIETVNSVLEQSFQNYEILIIDDGSTDNTEELIKFKYSSKINVRYVKISNHGACYARNIGIKQAKGTFIQFLDSDDILHPQKFEKQLEQFANKDIDISICNLQYFNICINDLQKGEEYKIPKNLLSSFIKKNIWNTSTPLYKKTFIEKIGYWNLNLQIMQDFEYSIRACLLSPKVDLIKEFLFYYRLPLESNNNISCGNTNKRLNGVYWALISIRKEINIHKRNSLNVAFALSKRFLWLAIDFKKNGFVKRSDLCWQQSLSCVNILIWPYVYLLYFMNLNLVLRAK